MKREVEIAALTLDPNTNSPVVVLKDKGGPDSIPIWIGFVEASAIAMELEKVEVGRPLTHDLAKNILTELGARLASIEVSDLKDNTYFATLNLERAGESLAIDSRPSDAIALAVRFDAPIFIAESVFNASRKIQEDQKTAGGAQKPQTPGEGEEVGDKPVGALDPAAAKEGEEDAPAFSQFRKENREEWTELLEKLDPKKLSKQ